MAKHNETRLQIINSHCVPALVSSHSSSIRSYAYVPFPLKKNTLGIERHVIISTILLASKLSCENTIISILHVWWNVSINMNRHDFALYYLYKLTLKWNNFTSLCIAISTLETCIITVLKDQHHKSIIILSWALYGNTTSHTVIFRYK